MSAPVPLNAPAIRVTRTGVLAALSVVLATGSVAVTLAVSTSGSADRPAAQGGGTPTTAEPDAAKTYHHAMRAR